MPDTAELIIEDIKTGEGPEVTGPGGIIPPSATLTFEIELLEISE